jgi:uncharacterized membrane protein (Fun14 family)
MITESFLTTLGFGGIVGFVIGVALRYIIKILALIAGLFFAALAYLQSQGILNVNWGKLQTLSQPLLSSLTSNLNSPGVAGHDIIHNNLPFLPVDMALPLAGAAGLGFVCGLRI